MLILVAWSLPSAAHDLRGHRGPTYEITEPIRIETGQNLLKLHVLEQGTGQPTAARFSLAVDGEAHTLETLGEGGLRFVSIHAGRKLAYAALYARGSGEVEVPLPPGARSGTVHLAKGLEYLPVEVPFAVVGKTAAVTAELRRWSDIRSKGWLPAEEHLHYDRTDPAHDRDWLTILAGDDLAYGHFLVLKGGNLPSIWATQYAYGKEGQAGDGQRLICPGEEYRDSMQGHINLLGIEEVIPPIQAGTPEHPYHYPAFYDVLQRARDLGGLVGPAHGTALGRSPSGIADTILVAVDFFEIANTHLYKTDVWYRLMNCGFIVPPAAGTDLPNFPFRDLWQPLLGEVRTYVHTGGKTDFDSFKQAVKRGEVFVSGGPREWN
ncbi:MAG TPA: CehA/McbA family metallohydrolase [Sedimentisphaerales bacterium]|nr:CehA/McbA family metallohydrolase [Sedimentisphaerales bacterium]